VANDINAVRASLAAFPGTQFIDTITAAEVGGYATNSPFTAANFTSQQVYFRLVSVGIRIKYLSTELNRGGATYSITEPDHQSVVGFGVSTALQYNSVHARGVSGREWHETLWFPIDATEIAYSDTPGAAGPFCMGIMVKAPTTTTFEWEYEVFCKFEAHGPLARGATVMMGDTMGGEAVLEHFAAMSSSGSAPRSNRLSIKDTVDNVTKIVKTGSGLYQSASNALSTAKTWWDSADLAVGEIASFL